MKVLLINPPSLNQISDAHPKIVETERGHYPPLGLLYIAGYLLKNSKHDVYVIDAQVDKLSYSQLGDRVREIKPDVVGITAMTFTLLDVLETVRLVKSISAYIKVVLGGPHVHIYPEETIQLPGVDFVVLGEGEITFAELLEVVDFPDRLGGLRGIVFRNNGSVTNTGPRPFIEDLDSLPYPARHLTNYKKYNSILAKRSLPTTTMFTSRGCPFVCKFCDRPHLGKTFRYRSALNVVDEMETCVRMGIQEFLIYDDTFTVNRQRVLDICDEIIRQKLDISWDARAHINTISEDMLDKMRDAGCTGIHYGVESGTERLLKLLNKGIKKQHVKEVFGWTKQRGIATLAYFMVGLPTETKEDIYETFRVIRELDPDYLHLTVFIPYPATQLYKEGLAQGIIKKDYWKEFAKEPRKDFTPPYWAEVFTKEELDLMIAEGYKSFYLRPKYLLKSFLGLKSISELRRKVKAGYSLISWQ
ncbi:MAG: radical SAM protein [Candidatus Brocadiales bacterium]|nr:radical SAM protein [Candidatus Brocadiales bacterium]